MYKLLIALIALIATASACDSCDETTISVNMHGFSDGVYDFKSSITSSGSDWERNTAFTPDMMMSELNINADKCFNFNIKDELWFNKVPFVPTDPYLMMNLAVTGKNNDDFEASIKTLYDIHQGAMMTSNGDGSFKSLDYNSFVDNFHGWTASAHMTGTDESITFEGTHSYDAMLDKLLSKLEISK